MRAHEIICVFYKRLPTYNPQKWRKETANIGRSKKASCNHKQYNAYKLMNYTDDGTRYPLDVIVFSNGNHASVHPTQKPVELLKYLINTYSNAGDLVLDNCMGSGSTGVAALETGRRFIGYELNGDYFNVAAERIEQAAGCLMCL